MLLVPITPASAFFCAVMFSILQRELSRLVFRLASEQYTRRESALKKYTGGASGADDVCARTRDEERNAYGRAISETRETPSRRVLKIETEGGSTVDIPLVANSNDEVAENPVSAFSFNFTNESGEVFSAKVRDGKRAENERMAHKK